MDGSDRPFKSLLHVLCCDDVDDEARRKRRIDEEVERCRMSLCRNEERARIPRGGIEKILKEIARKQNPVIISPQEGSASQHAETHKVEDDQEQ